MRNKADNEHAMCTLHPAPTYKKSCYCLILPLSVLLMLGSGSPAKKFVSFKRKDPAVGAGEVTCPREGSGMEQGGLGENSALSDLGKEKPELIRISSSM